MTEDFLFQQMATITKAHAYDIATRQIVELKATLKQLIEVGELDDLEFTTEKETVQFKAVLNKAKILSL